MDKPQLAAEFNRLTNALIEAATSHEIGNARIDLEVFAVREMLPIAAALTEWAQQRDEQDNAIRDTQQKLRAFIGSVESLETLVARLKERA